MANNEQTTAEEAPLLDTYSTSDEDDGNASVPAEADTGKKTVGIVRIILVILALGVLVFVQAMNITMLTTTQSVIATDLDAFSEASWLTSAYLIAISSVAPLFGRLSQIFSPRSCISVATVISAVGALVTSSADHLVHFLVGRAIMGVGAAGVMTVATILVLQASGEKRRGLFIGCLNSGFTMGVALGAVMAGELVSSIGWRALFWAQSPFFVAAGLTLYLSIPILPIEEGKSSEDQKLLTKVRQIDFLGAILLSTSILFFLYAFSASSIPIWPIIVSLVLFPCFMYNELRISADPIIPVIVLKSRGALLSCFATLGFMMSRWMVLFYTPVWAIAVRGWSAASAGSILVPTNAGFAIGGLLAGWIHIRRAGSFWSACLLSFGLFSTTEYVLAQVSTTETKAWAYFLLTFLNGACTGASLNYSLAHILHLTSSKTHFITITLLSTFRGFGGTFGSTIGGGLFQRILKSTLEKGFAENGLMGRGELVRELLGSPALVSSLTGAEHQVAITAYEAALKGVFLGGGILSTLMIFVQAGTGWAAPTEEEEEAVLVS
ncbi:hypothetical protein MMC25_001253 [Agyrium rufum]|nr:hypothetical protein [Agyrium rufum]